MGNYKLTLSYDGSRYAGWQRQGNTGSTIQRKVEETLSRVLDEAVQVSGCGRTDAGVHARMQVCSFYSSALSSPEKTLTLLRRYLPEDIAAVRLEAAPPRFHARLSCREKTYRYRVWRSDCPNVFERKYLYSFPEPLSLPAMREAADAMTGTHDFAAFSSGRTNKSTVRTVREIVLSENGPELTMSFTGDGFLYHMVRIMAGTLLEAGQGKRTAEDVRLALQKKDRSLAGFTAPAQGLTLWDIQY